MHKFEDLIRSFQGNQSVSEKASIIVTLEDLDDSRVLPFFLQTLRDKSEYDVVRIEILKILRLRIFSDHQQQNTAAEVITDILSADSDNLVRQFAAIATSNFMDVSGVESLVETIVTNSSEERDVRWNLFGALERAGPDGRRSSIVERLCEDLQFRQAAQRVLRKWSGKGHH